MEKRKSIMEEIIGIVVGGFFVLVAMVIIFGIAWLSVESHFMFFKLEKNPKLITIIDEVAHDICEEEGIAVFHKPYAEVNKNVSEMEAAIGMYVYTLDSEYQETIRKTLKEIETMEAEYGMPYEKICKMAGVDTSYTKEAFTYPRIILCKDTLLKCFGWNGYYSTFFHELGHHFAAKEMGKHTEKDADEYSYKLMKERLPRYFLLFYDFNFEYRLGKPILKRREKALAYAEYLKYNITKNNNIFKFKFA